MFTEKFADTMFVLAVALVVGAATAALAVVNYEANASLAALDAPSASAAARSQNLVTGYDNSGAAIFWTQPTGACLLSLMQQSVF